MQICHILHLYELIPVVYFPLAQLLQTRSLISVLLVTMYEPILQLFHCEHLNELIVLEYDLLGHMSHSILHAISQ